MLFIFNGHLLIYYCGSSFIQNLVRPHLNVKHLSTWPMPLYFKHLAPQDGDVVLLVTGGPKGFVDFLGQL